MKVLAYLISPEASLLGLQMASVLLYPHTEPSLCMYTPGVSPFSHRGNSLHLSFKVLIYKYSLYLQTGV